MSAAQLMSYYPKYQYLDDVLAASGMKQLNLYVDVKGCMQALFQEWAVKSIILQSQDSQMVDSSPFAAVLEFISFHKLYAKKRNIGLKMFLFLETGKSTYHLEIHKKYKWQRGIGDFFGLDDAQRDLFYKVLDKNYEVVDRVCNKIPNVTCIRLKYLEADFIPYYLMEHVLPDEVTSFAANIVYSVDKDMLQCLNKDNIYQFYKHYKSVKMITKDKLFDHYFKCDLKWKLGAEWFPMILSIDGDVGDGFTGVKGVSLGTIKKIMPQIVILCGGSMAKVYENIHNKQSIFDKSYYPNNNALKKIMANEEIIVRNLKLASFKLLSDYVNGGYPSVTIENKNLIESKIFNDEKISKAIVLYNALNSAGLTGLLEESTIGNLFV